MEVIFDKVGFPLVKVPSQDFWIHMWPVTKIQFEHFLSDEPNPDRNASWYDQILANSPRITPARVTTRNYWQLFIAGIHPENEIPAFVEWIGKDYSLPTANEWITAYKSFATQESIPDLIATLKEHESTGRSDPLVDVISQKIQLVVPELAKSANISFADQCLMRRGMMEWVKLTGESSDWGGLGKPVSVAGWPSTTANIDQGQPEIVRTLSIRHYGFRLIKRN